MRVDFRFRPGCAVRAYVVVSRRAPPQIHSGSL
jgi:hypothetical protein